MLVGDSLTGAARRRNELEEALQSVEKAAAAPAAHKTWGQDLVSNVRQLQSALNHHIAEVEAPRGLLEQVVEKAPRLQRAVESSRNHHAVLAHAIADLIDLIQSGEAAAADIRVDVIEILNDFARHRQDGADLIYEAYDVDIGGY
jgi:chromosome segregation ATPase